MHGTARRWCWSAWRREAKIGLGYTYADAATGKLVQTLLEKVVHGREAFEHGAILQALYRTFAISARPASRRWLSPRSTMRSGICARGCWMFRWSAC